MAKKKSTIGITFNLKRNTLYLTYKYSDYKSVFDMFLLTYAPLSLPWRQMFTTLITKRPASFFREMAIAYDGPRGMTILTPIKKCPLWEN